MEEFEIKAHLLNQKVCFSNNILDGKKEWINKENLHKQDYVFFKTKKGLRVKMQHSLNSCWMIDYDIQNKYFILKKDSKIILKNIIIEKPLLHAPEQLFLGLYDYCSVKCMFCPLAYSTNLKHYSLDIICSDLEVNKNKNIKSIGLTTAVPYSLSLEDLADELCLVIKKIKQKFPNLPIGVSTKCPSKLDLLHLHQAGAEEIRLNMELYDETLASNIMPNKSIKEIKKSLLHAVEIFGFGKVSCNFIVGLGETDESILNGIIWCCQRGIMPTLYPYENITSSHNIMSSIISTFSTPSPQRLIALAKQHYSILKEYDMLHVQLKTMCPSCAASHIYPPTDMKEYVFK